MPKPKPKIVTITEAAEILGLRSPHHIRHLIRQGKIKAPKIPDSTVSGFHYAIPLSEILRYQQLKFKRGWVRGKRRSKS